MSNTQVPSVPVIPDGPGLTQLQRVLYTYSAPSKTFADVRRSSAWWLPYLIIVISGAFLFAAITTQVTWRQVYENNQRNAPKFARDMIERMPADAKARQEVQGPITQEITWALSPLGLLLINVIAAAILLPTINFGFGGKASFGKLIAVTMYSGLVSWVPRLLLGGIALFAGMPAESFNVQNVAGTNLGYYLNQQETAPVLYSLATALDPLVIWNLVVTSIGVAVVAGTKRSSGFIAVFGWWILIMLILVGASAAFS